VTQIKFPDLATTMTFDLWPWKPSSNGRWNDDCLWQVSLKFVHRVKRNCVTRDRC